MVDTAVDQKINQYINLTRSLHSAETQNILTTISGQLGNALANNQLTDGDSFPLGETTEMKLKKLIDLIGSKGTGGTPPTAPTTIGTGLFGVLDHRRGELDANITTNEGILRAGGGRGGTGIAEASRQITSDRALRSRISATETGTLDPFAKNLNDIYDVVKAIDTSDKTLNQTGTFDTTTGTYNTGFTNITLTNAFIKSVGGTRTPPTGIKYSLCDGNGNTLSRNPAGDYEVTIDGTKYTLSGISINTGTNQLEFTGVTLNPPQNYSPLSLKLSIKANVDVTVDADTIHVIHNKPLELKFENAAVNALDHAAMETQYASLNLDELIVNTTTEPSDHKEYEHRVNRWEEECLEEVLGKGELKPEFDRIKSDATLKEILMKRMKECLFGSTSVLFSNGHVFADNTVIQDTFRAYVTDETIIDKEKRKNITVYKDFLTANYKSLFKNSCKKFITGELSKDIIHDELNKVFSKFLQDESDGKFDNAQFHLESLRLLDARTNTTNNWRKNPHSFGLGVFNHLRYNYSNLMSGLSAEIKGQKFDYTDNGKEKSTTYNLNLDCKKENHFELSITIQEKEKYPLHFVTNTPDKLMHAILKTAFTPDREPLNSKLRVRMVLSALKALMVMCPGTEEREDYHVLERNCTDVPGYERLRVEKSDSGKLRIIATHLEDAGTGSPKYVAKTKTLFDEDTFMQLNDISLLEEGLGRVAGEITRQLNNKAKRHKKSIDTGITRRKSEMSKNYQPVSFFRNIFNLRKDTDFSFQTTTQSGIEIQFNAKKNRWTLKKGDYNITKKDIGKILQDKHFNGKQFEIISAINKAELENMYDKDPSLSGRYFIVNDASTTGIARKYVIYGNELYTLDALVYEDKDSLKEGKAHEISLSTLPGGLQVCTAQEKENFFTNPVLVGRMIKCMKGKLKFRTKKSNQKGKVIPLYSGESFRQAA